MNNIGEAGRIPVDWHKFVAPRSCPQQLLLQRRPARFREFGVRRLSYPLSFGWLGVVVVEGCLQHVQHHLGFLWLNGDDFAAVRALDGVGREVPDYTNGV